MGEIVGEKVTDAVWDTEEDTVRVTLGEGEAEDELDAPFTPPMIVTPRRKMK